MSGPLSKLDDRIEALERASEELRTQTREAHATIKELRRARKEIEALLKATPKELVETAIEEAVAEGLKSLGETTREAMDNAVSKVASEFDQLADLFVKGDGGNDEHLLAAANAARMKRMGELAALARNRRGI